MATGADAVSTNGALGECDVSQASGCPDIPEVDVLRAAPDRQTVVAVLDVVVLEEHVRAAGGEA